MTLPRRGVLDTLGSGTPIEKRHREISEAVARCAPNPEARFDAGAYDQDALARAASMWRARVVSEHRSTAVFSALTVQLMEANATLDAKSLVLSMAQDELRHTEYCADVVRALGGDPRCTVDLTVEPLALHAGRSPEERALRNVIYGSCVSEVVNAARFVDTLEETADPFVRDTIRRLLADEVMHGQFGFFYLHTWSDWLAARPEVRASIASYLRFALAIYEQRAAGADGPKLTEDERALGIPDPTRAREVFYETIEYAVLPGLERFGIEATRAWEERSLQAR